MNLTLSLAQASGAPNTWVLWSLIGLLGTALAVSAGYLLFWLNRRLTAANAAVQERDDKIRFLTLALTKSQAENQERARQSEQLQSSINRLQAECAALRQRISEPAPPPPFSKEVYLIATIGIDTCGKTALTRKWAEPTLTLSSINATKFDSYEKMVFRQNVNGCQVEHTFQILDWGGEHLVTAQEQLVTLGELRALIFVVDLGEFDAKQQRVVFSQARINRQLEKFSPHLLPFFFGERIASHCRTCVLFINKSDVLQEVVPGGMEVIVDKAKQYFISLIAELERVCADRGVELEVMVGSATTGHNTHTLFAYLQHQLLEEEAQPAPVPEPPIPVKVGTNAPTIVSQPQVRRSIR